MASRKPKRAAKAKSAPKPAAKKVTKNAAKKATKKTAKKATKKTVAKKTVAKNASKKTVAKKTVAKNASKKTVAKKTVAKKTVAKKKKPGATTKTNSVPPFTSAREALSALAQKRAIKATLEPVVDDREVVDAYMRDVDHPFKAELEAVRRIILGASPKISERIKWNAPSFYYKEDLGAFNPRATEYAHLILLFPGGGGMQADDGLLEGEHKDRREVKFHGMDDVTAKKPALEKLIKRWVALRDR
jgi:hypothetical protein